MLFEYHQVSSLNLLDVFLRNQLFLYLQSPKKSLKTINAIYTSLVQNLTKSLVVLLHHWTIALLDYC